MLSEDVKAYASFEGIRKGYVNESSGGVRKCFKACR